MTRFDELRAKHPRFTYEDYAVERVGGDLRFTFSFTMAPDLVVRAHDDAARARSRAPGRGAA